MEFKIWGRLDESGRIQSIQSNCSGVNHDVGSLPYVCSGSHDKKLVYKLDSKTDEMSLLILQMSEMSKRIQLQEKLLAEYEDKFKRQQKEIELLRRENNCLRNRDASGNCSVPVTPATNPASFSYPVTTFEMTCNLKCKPFKHHSCPTMSTEPDVFSSSGTESSESCSTCASAECSSGSEQRSLDNVDGFAFGDRSRTENVANANLLNPVDLNERVSFEVSDVCCNQTDESKLIEGVDGYVLTANHDKVVNQFNQFNDEPNDVSSRSEHNTVDNNIQDINPDCEENTQCSNMREKINSRVCSPTPHTCSTPSSCRSSLSIDTDKNGYLILDKTTPSLREICREEIHGTWLSVNLKIQQSQSGTFSDEVEGHIISQRPTSTEIRPGYRTDESSEGPSEQAESPRTALKHNPRPSHGYVEIDESQLDPDFQSKRNSEPINLYVPTQDQTRSSSSSVAYSEDDQCNVSIKTMRTTMEWAKAKKGLLKESNDITVEKVESLLRDSVKEIYTTLKHYESSKPYRMNKPVADKAMAVQRHLRHSQFVEIISDDFLRKCVMVCSSKMS